MTTRRQFSAQEKVAILRLHLLEHKPVSEICEQYQLNPTVFYRWQKDLFDHGTAAFDRAENGSADRTTQKLQKENTQLKSKLASKDEVIAEIEGLLAGTVALVPREDYMELTGLTTEPFFRGRGVGHALAEYAVDRWGDVDSRNRMMSQRDMALPDELWLLTELPMYFQPVGFHIPKQNELRPSIKNRLSPTQTAMIYKTTF